MPSCKSIITLALSKLGVTGGTKTPRDVDLTLGLTTLQSLYRQLISSGALGRARPVVPTGNYTARENDRIMRTADLVSIAIPQLVPVHEHHGYGYGYDDAIYDVPGCNRMRPPHDGAFIVINDTITGRTTEQIYDAYVNLWTSIQDLSLSEDGDVKDPATGLVIAQTRASLAPLSFRDTNGLAALLATKLADHFGATLTQTTIRDALNYQSQLSNKFGEPEDELHHDYF